MPIDKIANKQKYQSRKVSVVKSAKFFNQLRIQNLCPNSLKKEKFELWDYLTYHKLCKSYLS